jgi:hypothetical protein
MSHVTPRDLVQLSVDKRNQPLEGAFVALSPLQQQSGDLRGIVRNAPILAFRGRVQVFGAISRFPDQKENRDEEQNGNRARCSGAQSGMGGLQRLRTARVALVRWAIGSGTDSNRDGRVHRSCVGILDL